MRRLLPESNLLTWLQVMLMVSPRPLPLSPRPPVAFPFFFIYFNSALRTGCRILQLCRPGQGFKLQQHYLDGRTTAVMRRASETALGRVEFTTVKRQLTRLKKKNVFDCYM